MIPRAAAEVLREGVLCATAARRSGSPHVTPVVYALESGRVWATTARSSVKAKLWHERPEAAGMVRAGERAVTFRGVAEVYDALDPGTWPRSIARAPRLALATARFTIRNLRFFAGYARDARKIPLGWTPPGRVFVSLSLEAGAVLDVGTGRVLERWGNGGEHLEGKRAFARLAPRPLVDRDAPPEVLEALGHSGEGSIGLDAGGRLTVLPVRWLRDAEEGSYYALVAEDLLAVSGISGEAPATLVADHSSKWRAAEMAGLQLRGTASVFLPAQLERGAGPLRDRVGALLPGTAVMRLRPGSAVWWRGWSSGSLVRR